MTYGIRTSALGAMSQEAKLSIIANNIANSDTTGFKADRVTFRERLVEALEGAPEMKYYNSQVHKNGGAPFIESVRTEFNQGTIKQTGHKFDFAVEGEGFFVLRDLASKKMYLTRNGAFKIDNQGNLLSQDGRYEVLSADLAPIKVGIDQPLDISVSRDGTMYQNNAEFAKIGIYLPRQEEQLRKHGDNLYDIGNTVLEPALRFDVHQGGLEKSAVNSFAEMTEMIQTVRNIETNLRMVTLQDLSLERLIGIAART